MLEQNDRSVSPSKAGWRINQFCSDTGISRALTYQLMAAGRIKSVKCGTARIITTSPAEFLASLASPAGEAAADPDPEPTDKEPAGGECGVADGARSIRAHYRSERDDSLIV